MSNSTVFVSGLPTSASQDDIADFFNRIGSVAEVQLPAADSTAPVAVVFDKAEDVAVALSISGSDFQEGVPIQIVREAAMSAAAGQPAADAHDDRRDDEESHRRDSRDRRSEDRNEEERPARSRDAPNPRESRSDITNKVIVSQLPPYIPRKEVQEAFAHCGEMDDFAMVPPRHIAFLGFTTAEGFEKALAMDGAKIRDATIRVERRIPNLSMESRPNPQGNGAPRVVPNRIIVRDVPHNITKEAVRSFFAADCGEPTDVFIRGESGIAFVAFADEEATSKALAKSGQELGGAVIHIEAREVLVCRRCGKEGHKALECRQPYCTDCRTTGHASRDCPRARGGARRGNRGGERRRRRSTSSSSSDRDRRRRRHRSDSSDRDRRRRRHSRSRSPPRRRRHSPSRSRSPPRGRR